jgi:RHS repeat-associated protein
LLEETNASGVAQADYIYLDGRPVAVLNGSTLYYLHDDMLGTPQLTTDSNQAIAWQASYDPFGEASVSGTITQNLRLPGQYFDVESGWNHNGFRDYAPTLGRYIEPDPLGRLGSGNNLYVYAADNPIKYVDPLGLAVCVYSISAHTMICISSSDPNASPIQMGPEGLSSGNGGCANNTSAACLDSVFNGDPNSGGPVDPGLYQVTYMNRDDGADRFDLAELSDDWFSRAMRALHGRRKAFQLHRGTISHGCINANKNDPEAVKQFDQIKQLLMNEQNQGLGDLLKVIP